jgi:hypothetical protein
MQPVFGDALNGVIHEFGSQAKISENRFDRESVLRRRAYPQIGSMDGYQPRGDFRRNQNPAMHRRFGQAQNSVARGFKVLPGIWDCTPQLAVGWDGLGIHLFTPHP